MGYERSSFKIFLTKRIKEGVKTIHVTNIVHMD